ncbi:response regulator [Frigoriglobus tundricola]|uniref:Response regulator of zinc sigma-54-dependent two-component system n=1 Tax=Frigoriglobus tundricola TaxID=2774151 RepID=A0A6M5YNN2_9BACT|nr:response regulator [Frigoriglobus tundricola]QJW94980.1 Response regulator of zinc sigma-54-dependent two-component system [Frigoriglobus tundricola]
MSQLVSRGRLLVVDDEVELLRALCEALAEAGFAVQSLSDPTRVPAAVRAGAFDVLLIDLLMPDLDGIQLFREVRGIDPALIGVIMTGQGTNATSVEAMRAGAFEYLLKPFRLKTVLSALDRAMYACRLGRENACRGVRGREIAFEFPGSQSDGHSSALHKVRPRIE